MTERDKLINLMKEIPTGNGGTYDISFFADHLIANGVTVRKTGRWIIHSNGRGKHATNWAECSECRVCGSPQWKVCPVCDTKMEDT